MNIRIKLIIFKIIVATIVAVTINYYQPNIVKGETTFGISEELKKNSKSQKSTVKDTINGFNESEK